MAQAHYDTAFYDQHVAASLSSARVVLPILTEYYQAKSVVDVGCGRGAWLRAAIDCGMEDALGIDGDYVEKGSLLIDPSRFLSADLAERLDVGRRFDLAISVEVAEHLPYHRSETFVADLVKLSPCVLFSAALPYQGGTNHVNEQWLEFWAIFFRRHGYVACDLFRPRIWSDKRVEYWYCQNLIVFSKHELAFEIFPKETLAPDRPLSFPHPLTLLENVARIRPLAGEARELETSDYASLLEAYTAGETTQPILKATVKDAANEPGVGLFPTARMRIMDAAELIALYAGLKHAQRELLAHAGEIDRLVREVAARTADVDQLSGALHEREGEIVARTADVDRLSGSLREREAEIAALAADIDRLSDAMREREAEVAARTADIVRLSGAMREREAEVAARTADIDRLSHTLRQSEGEIHNLRVEQAVSEAENGRLQAELSARTSKCLALSADLAARDRLHKQLSARLDVGEEEIQRLMNRLAEEVAGFSRLSSDYRSLQNRFDSVTVENKDREEETRRMTAVLRDECVRTAHLSQEVADRDRAIQWLHGVLADRNKRLADIERSLTWRLTAPVHSFRNLRHWISFKNVRAKWYARVIEPSGLFDREYYISHNADVAGADPVSHYISRGAAEGRKPNPLFDTSFYLHEYPDVADSGMNPLAHYVAFGAAEGRRPCPLFDPKFYFSRNPDLDPKTVNPLHHYLTKGAAERRDPHPLFDTSFYLRSYPEVAQGGLNPLDHYLTFGAAEGCDPNPLFDTSYYLERNPEVAHSGMNPLAHYESIGAAARHDPDASGAAGGLDPHPQFDTSYYVERYPDVSETGMNPLAHYLWIGCKEGREPHAPLDTPEPSPRNCGPVR